MTDHCTNRRTILIAAGAAAAAAVADTALAQSTNIRGIVNYEGGTAVPEGQIAIYLEDPALPNGTQNRAAETHVKSDGGARTIAFSFPPPESSSPTLQIIARLERKDGWLLARGSAQYEAGAPVSITLNTAMY